MARQIVQPWFRRDDYETMRQLVPTHTRHVLLV
jgi:hypothetical protein